VGLSKAPAEAGTTNHLRRRRGTILIVILWISSALVSTALLFGHSMMMEYRAAENTVAGLQAAQAIEGAERYAAYVLKNNEKPGHLPDLQTYKYENVELGDARFWFIGRPLTDSKANSPVFGLVDEGSKLNLNTATREMLEALPCMTAELAAAIVDWRDSDSDLTPDGAETQNYLLRTPKYNCKNSKFETIEELRLLVGGDYSVLYGEDTNLNGILDPNENDGSDSPPNDDRDGTLDPGVLEYVTVWSAEPTSASDGTALVSVRGDEQALTDLLTEKISQTRAEEIVANLGTSRQNIRSLLEFYIRSQMSADEFALVADSLTASDGSTSTCIVNVNTASGAVLACIPGIGQSFAEQLVSYRQGKTDELNTIAWVATVLDQDTATSAGPYLTTRSARYSVDVAAASATGRGFRRAQFIVDANGQKPVVLFRRDLSRLGWPLGATVRAQLTSTSDQERR
jgi:DNA uptake protein ComE-like DNA-binding protein